MDVSPSLRGPPIQEVLREELSNLTLDTPILQPTPKAPAPNLKVTKLATEVDQPRAPVEDTNEKVYHTPKLDNRQMSKTGGSEATHGKERNLPYFLR